MAAVPQNAIHRQQRRRLDRVHVRREARQFDRRRTTFAKGRVGWIGIGRHYHRAHLSRPRRPAAGSYVVKEEDVDLVAEFARVHDVAAGSGRRVVVVVVGPSRWAERRVRRRLVVGGRRRLESKAGSSGSSARVEVHRRLGQCSATSSAASAAAAHAVVVVIVVGIRINYRCGEITLCDKTIAASVSGVRRRPAEFFSQADVIGGGGGGAFEGVRGPGYDT